MSSKQGIWVDGERELFLNMQRTLDGSIKAGNRGLESAAMNIIADAKENLRGNESVVTGQLRASGRVQRAQDDEQALEAGFFSQGSSGYAFFVEYGRRSGKMPPVDDIEQWLKKKNRRNKAVTSAAAFMGKTRSSFLRSIAWAIAKRIAKKGTKPHPFLGPAVEKNQKQISEAIKVAIQDAIR